MENNPTWILGVALALFDKMGRLLLQQRLAGKHHGGYWEFPGGKVESGETPRLALVREIEEELGIALSPDVLTPVSFAEEPGAPGIVLNLYTARLDECEPQARDGQAWGWYSLTDAAELPLAPMDRELLAFMSR